MSTSYTGGTNFTWPTLNDTNWAAAVDAALQVISGHNHSGGGSGAALPANAIDDTQIRLRNASSLRARNAAGNADINLIALGSGDLLELQRVFRLTSTETLVASGALSLTTTVSLLNGSNLAMTLANGTEGQVKIVVNTLASSSAVSTVTPATTAGPNTIALRQYGVAVLYYLGSEWRILCGPNTTCTDDSETLVASGAVSLNTRHTILNGASMAMTLADGSEGQVKIITNIATTAATVSPATTTVENLVTLQTDGVASYASVMYVFLSGKWHAFRGHGATLQSQSVSAADTYNGYAPLVICTGTTYAVTMVNGYPGQTVLVENRASGNVTFGSQVMATGTYYLYSYLNSGWRRVALA